MNTKTIGFATLLCAIASTVFSAPTLTITPAGVQGGNWVWNVDLTPDLTLVPDGSGTPVAVELGFRLSGGSLISIINVNPSGPQSFDTSNPGAKIFGWEITYPEDNNRPEGIEANCTGCTISNPTGAGHPATLVPGTLNEMFVAMGSNNFTTAGAKPFLKITATGPSGGSPSSTLQWLGAYGTGSNKGRITQVNGMIGPIYTTGNFDTFAGSLTQSVPEPASAALVAVGAIAVPFRRRRKV
jgi:hypothetical protein